MNQATQSMPSAIAPVTVQPWRAVMRSNAPELPPKLKAPGDYDPILFDCTFSPIDKADKLKVEHVLDASGMVIGMGSSREQACWFAARVRRSEMQQPEHYYPTLRGFSFGVESHHASITRTVLDPSGQVVGRGHDKQSASKQANLSVLHDKPLASLTSDEFAQMCVVVTVELMRARAGKPRPGVALLRPDRFVNSGIADLRQAISQESDLLHVNINDRVHWREERLHEVMSLPLVNGSVQHMMLTGGQFVILRTQLSQPKAQCIESVFEMVRASLTDQPEHIERPRAA